MEINEMYQMFVQNGINIQQDELHAIFNIVDEDGSGSLSLQEFEAFIVDKAA